VKLRAALGAYIDADLTSAASDSGLRTARRVGVRQSLLVGGFGGMVLARLSLYFVKPSY
jgi:hypothetical protein